jgi:hypothetical protein
MEYDSCKINTQPGGGWKVIEDKVILCVPSPDEANRQNRADEYQLKIPFIIRAK